MTEIEAVRQRHSVRSYSDRKIENDKEEQLEALLREANASGSLHLQFIADAGKTFSRLFSRVMGLSSAPSVIACVGRNDDTIEERIGYYGEKVVLAAQTMGLNTCWVGGFNKSGVPAEIGSDERLVIVIAIGYGENPGKQHKSKKAEQVSAASGARPAWFDLGVELALLAPTAINQQKFMITLNGDGSVSFADKGGPFSKVDLGIVKYHFDLARESSAN